ncbi:MAG: energy transducer TonB [Fidelibacterota bacterium]
MSDYTPQLKFNYSLTVRIAGLVGILIITFGFLFVPRSFTTVVLEDANQIIIEQIDIPQTQQFDLPPPPARPSVPIESESEDLADDLTIEETDLESFEAWDAPPPPPEGPQVKFIPYDDPPKPLSPIRPKYPEIAQEAGIEGTVIVQVFVDKKGRVKETSILKGIPNTGLDEAAIEAIRRTRFRPAKQRERAVGVWISIPVNFRLK